VGRAGLYHQGVGLVVGVRAVGPGAGIRAGAAGAIRNHFPAVVTATHEKTIDKNTHSEETSARTNVRPRRPPLSSSSALLILRGGTQTQILQASPAHKPAAALRKTLESLCRLYYSSRTAS